MVDVDLTTENISKMSVFLKKQGTRVLPLSAASFLVQNGCLEKWQLLIHFQNHEIMKVSFDKRS